MSAEERPDWLPEGWNMGVRTTRSGSKHPYYMSLESGRLFASKEDVLNYLNNTKGEAADQASNYMPHSIVDKKQISGAHWLPKGWILEIKTQKSGFKKGKKYKCYFDPSTGARLYSKQEVFRYLEKGETSCKSDLNKGSRILPTTKVKDLFEWLPHGWVVEIKTRMTGPKAGKKYKCYFDPSTGARFYSKQDVCRYLAKGEKSSESDLNKGPGASLNIAKGNDIFGWLPSGWVVEVKTRMSGPTAGTKYRCYFNPSSGARFYSKKEVFRYISKAEHSGDNLQCQIQQSPECSPHGHAKEGLHEKDMPEISSKKQKSGCTTRRCLFSGQTPGSKRESSAHIKNIRERPESSLHYDSSICIEDIKSVCLDPVTVEQEIPLVCTSSQRNSFTHEKRLEQVMRGSEMVTKSETADSVYQELSETMDPSAKEHFQPAEATKNWGSESAYISPNEPTELVRAPLEDKPIVQGTTCCSDELVLDRIISKKSTVSVRCDRDGANKYKNVVVMARRTSKRLAGSKADYVSEPNTSKKATRLKRSRTEASIPSVQPAAIPTVGVDLSEKLENNVELNQTLTIDLELPRRTEEIVEKQSSSLDARNDILNNLPESQMTLSSWASWPDPCIEFAFKTLTSDIPFLDDSLALEEYFQQQLVSVQSSCTKSAVLPSNCSDTKAETSIREDQPKNCSLSIQENINSNSASNGVHSIIKEDELHGRGTQA